MIWHKSFTSSTDLSMLQLSTHLYRTEMTQTHRPFLSFLDGVWQMSELPNILILHHEWAFPGTEFMSSHLNFTNTKYFRILFVRMGIFVKY